MGVSVNLFVVTMHFAFLYSDVYVTNLSGVFLRFGVGGAASGCVVGVLLA